MGKSRRILIDLSTFFGVITARDAVRFGAGRRALAQAVHSGNFKKVGPGQYQFWSIPPDDVRASHYAKVRARFPDAFVWGLSACWLHGLIPERPPLLHLARPRHKFTPPTKGIRWRTFSGSCATVGIQETTIGLKISNAARAVVELFATAAELPSGLHKIALGHYLDRYDSRHLSAPAEAFGYGTTLHICTHFRIPTAKLPPIPPLPTLERELMADLEPSLEPTPDFLKPSSIFRLRDTSYVAR